MIHAPAESPRYMMSLQKTPYQHTGPGRVYTYTIPEPFSHTPFVDQARSDLMGNPVNLREVDSILRQYLSQRPQPPERHLVVHLGDWIGHYTITQNEDPTTVILRSLRTSDERIAASLEDGHRFEMR